MPKNRDALIIFVIFSLFYHYLEESMCIVLISDNQVFLIIHYYHNTFRYKVME